MKNLNDQQKAALAALAVAFTFAFCIEVAEPEPKVPFLIIGGLLGILVGTMIAVSFREWLTR